VRRGLADRLSLEISWQQSHTATLKPDTRSFSLAFLLEILQAQADSISLPAQGWYYPSRLSPALAFSTQKLS
jgi:hypothetical protein